MKYQEHDLPDGNSDPFFSCQVDNAFEGQYEHFKDEESPNKPQHAPFNIMYLDISVSLRLAFHLGIHSSKDNLHRIDEKDAHDEDDLVF